MKNLLLYLILALVAGLMISAARGQFQNEQLVTFAEGVTVDDTLTFSLSPDYNVIQDQKLNLYISSQPDDSNDSVIFKVVTSGIYGGAGAVLLTDTLIGDEAIYHEFSSVYGNVDLVLTTVADTTVIHAEGLLRNNALSIRRLF